MKHLRNFLNKSFLHGVVTMSYQQPTITQVFLTTSIFGITSVGYDRHFVEFQLIFFNYLAHSCHTTLFHHFHQCFRRCLFCYHLAIRKKDRPISGWTMMYFVIFIRMTAMLLMSNFRVNYYLFGIWHISSKVSFTAQVDADRLPRHI